MNFNLNPKRLIVLSAVVVLGAIFLGFESVEAMIYFQDDFFHDIHSPGIIIDYDGGGQSNTIIRFGNDFNLSGNGHITWDINDNEFQFDHSVNIAGNVFVADDIEAVGDVNFSAATQLRIRESGDPNSEASCQSLGELIYDTTDQELQVCGLVGIAPSALWLPLQAGIYNNYLSSDSTDNYTNGVITFDPNTILDVSEAIVNLDEISNGVFILNSGNTGLAPDVDIDIIAEQGSDLDGALRYSTGNDRWELSNDSGPFLPFFTGGDMAAVQVRRTTEFKLNCGNSFVNDDEECDDGNSISGDGCSGMCLIEPGVCGNTVIESGEQCDPAAIPNGCSSELDCSNCTCVVPVPLPNPPLAEACGLNVVLMLDSSDSLDWSELQDVRDAANAFVDDLEGTPTFFGVIDFDNAVVTKLQLTDDIAAVKTAINSIGHISDLELTNWEAALIEGQAMFPNDEGCKPSLLVAVTDGDPTTWGYPNSQGSYGGVEPDEEDINRAIIAANAAKTMGTRVLTIGVGTAPTVENLSKISGPNIDTGDITADVIITDFGDLRDDLVDYATVICGGTITVNKHINSVDPYHRASEGWIFNVAGEILETDDNGQTEDLEVAKGTGYSVIAQNSYPGFAFDSASCRKQGDVPVGDPTTNGVINIEINDDDIIKCEFLSFSDCGNGVREGIEECDDGDYIDWDGCSAFCEIEQGDRCEGDNWVTIEFPLTDIENDVSNLEHSDNYFGRVNIKEDGMYQVSYQINIEDDRCLHSLSSRICVNDLLIVNGSYVENQTTRSEYNPALGIAVVLLNDGDFLTLQAADSDSCPNNVVRETSMMIRRSGF